MAARYVPPALRKKAQNGAHNTVPTEGDAKGEGLARRRLSDLKASSQDEKQLHTLYELNKHYGSSLVHSTLRDTSSKPNHLGFVVLFRGANPKWASDRIIFAHTNIHILPGYQDFKTQSDAEANTKAEKETLDLDQEWQIVSKEDANGDEVQISDIEANEPASIPATTSETSALRDIVADVAGDEDLYPVPVFIEVGSRGTMRKFAFHGYFHLARVDFLQPHSTELVRMLQQKWDSPQQRFKKQREPEAWAKSLGQEWAVIQFTTIPKNKTPADPNIEIVHEEEIEDTGSSYERRPSDKNAAC